MELTVESLWNHYRPTIPPRTVRHELLDTRDDRCHQEGRTKRSKRVAAHWTDLAAPRLARSCQEYDRPGAKLGSAVSRHSTARGEFRI